MSTPAAPTLVSIDCITPVPRAGLNLTWLPSGDYDGPYTILVQDSSGKSMGSSQVASGNSGSWTASKDMDANGTYSLIVQTSDPNISTAPLPILVTPPQNVATSFDGKTVSVTWSNAKGLGARYARLGLRGDINQQIFAPVANYGFASVDPNSAPFPPGQRLWAQVGMVAGIATGPFSPPALVLQTRPAVSAISTAVSGGAATVTISTPSVKGYGAGQPFTVTLHAGDQLFYTWPPIASVKAADGSFQVPVPMAAAGWPLPAGIAFRFGLRQTNPTALGPSGLRQLYPAGVPAIEQFSYRRGATPATDQLIVSVSPPAGEAAASGAFVALVDAGGAIKASKQEDDFTLVLTVDRAVAAGCSLAVATTIGVAAGPLAAASDPLLESPPAILTLVYDGASALVSWTPLAGVPVYRVAAVGSAGVMASLLSGGGQALLAVPPGATGVTVAAVQGLSAGPEGGPVSLVITPPSLTGVAFAGGAATVSFGGVGQGEVLSYSVRNGAAQIAGGSLAAGVGDVPVDAATLLLGSDLSIVARLSVTDASGAVSTGPWSQAAPLVTQSPTAVAVAFDGRFARVSWSPSPSPHVTGYLAGIFKAGVLVKSEATSGCAAPIDCSALAAADDYQVVVTPMAGAIAGAPATAVPLFAPGWYLSAGADTSPHLVPASLMSRPAAEIDIFLPDIFSVDVDPTKMPASTVFALRRATDEEKPFSYVLSVPASSAAWSFAQDPVRPAVKAGVAALLSWLDNNNVTGYGLQLVGEAIGRAMPQSFAETLLYGAGLDLVGGYVDLRPGHVLQVQFETYQYQGVADTYLNGFVGGAGASYEVRSAFDANGRWLIGFDAFLSRMSAYMTVPKPSSAGASFQGGAGLADLYFTGFRQPYCRLVFPPDFLGLGDARQAGRGAPQPYYNLALVAASSLAALDAATDKLHQRSVDVGAAALLYFRGRTVMTVSHAVEIDGATQLVPVGTTVGNLLEGLGRRPPRGTLALRGISLARAAGPVIGGMSVASVGVDVAGALPVRLDWNPATPRPSPGPEWLDLPLLAGDRISLRAAGL